MVDLLSKRLGLAISQIPSKAIPELITILHGNQTINERHPYNE
jgi:hypothetical protein